VGATPWQGRRESSLDQHSRRSQPPQLDVYRKIRLVPKGLCHWVGIEETKSCSRPYAKAAKVSLDGSCVAFDVGGALRRAALERGASSCLDALPQLDGLLRCQCVGPTIPGAVYL
jgi:hypothetical protein